MDGNGSSSNNSGRGRGKPRNGRGGRGGGRGQGGNGNNNRSNNNNNGSYPPHWTMEECLAKYNAKDPNIIRGTLRVLPGRDAASFCTCDRGSQKQDVLIATPNHRNRALHGDTVFIELLPIEEGENADQPQNQPVSKPAPAEKKPAPDSQAQAGDKVAEAWWQDDPVQMNLWAPAVAIRRQEEIPKPASTDGAPLQQRKGRVIHVVPPKALASDIHPTKKTPATYRNIIGTLKRLQGGTVLLTSSNKCLPQFRCSPMAAEKFNVSADDAIYQARYVYGSWKEGFTWPPCADLIQMGQACNVEDETMALLVENQLDHGEFPSDVLEECSNVVASGEYTEGGESGWRPTPEMYKDRRDYRHKRIFTIDPTTARDLDDALHVEDLGNGQVEIGVHIADVSHFMPINSAIDVEAQRRCTTVYLVDRVLPMLPRPLCEIACSLNENVERLAFSCVWRMNLDGNMAKDGKQDSVWYGRTVIKSCARLDYATAQNIIDKKVANGENETDEELWPPSRRPTGGHTMDQVAADVRLMNIVAQARRRLRFQHGAVALSAIKLTFQLDEDRETPLLCQPYEIRDSNRLIEEYMLLANYLVAQRLITHAGERACLRNHEPPLHDGLEKVQQVAKEAIGFHIDITSSESLQKSLSRLGRECKDELVLQCVTEILKTPLQAATYIAAGEIPDEKWSHFALNIPYYTHFTSPIRRYADVIVHRLLQATLDGEEAVVDFPLQAKEIHQICSQCNDKKEASRKAQERSSVVFLALYLRRAPLTSRLGVVLSVGMKAFTVFVPELGLSAMVYLQEHDSWIKGEPYTHLKSERRIKLERTAAHRNEGWKELDIKTFTRVRVTCMCQDKPPISVKLELEGPWVGPPTGTGK
jgi:VacB/RNase II family 3'-5' exoribonuclease